MRRAPEPSADLVIIGGGPEAVFVARGYLEEGAARGWQREGRVVVVEPRSRVGVGAAWDERQSLMSSNMDRRTLFYWGPVTRDGRGFDLASARDLFGSEAVRAGLQTYVPRSEVGKRLFELYEETVAVARGMGVSLEHVRDKAVRVERVGTGLRVELAGGAILRTPCVVLALGLLSVDRFPQLHGHPGYHADSWNPGDCLSRIGSEDRVAIVGMGPTAVDWTLRLKALNLAHPVLLASRSGILPAVRPPVLARDVAGVIEEQVHRLSRSGPLSPREVDLVISAILERFGVTQAQLDAHCQRYSEGGSALMESTLASSGRPHPLFDALKFIDEFAPTLWTVAGPEARDHIIRRWARLHVVLSFAIPPTNARDMLSSVRSGRIRLLAGLETVEPAGARIQMRFARRDETSVEEVDTLINATGFDGGLATVNNALVRALHADGLLREGRHGGADMDYGSGAVLGGDGRRIDGLFIAGGSLTRSAGYAVNSLRTTSSHGLAVGASCARYLATAPQEVPADPDASHLQSITS